MEAEHRKTSLYEQCFMRTRGLIYNEGNNWEIVIGGQRVAISSEGFSFYKWYNLLYAQCVIQWKIGGLKVLETHPKVGIPLAQ